MQRNDVDLVLCPYNPSHTILKKRIQSHLVKCRKTTPDSEKLEICMFNATHHIPRREMEMHLYMCPDRILVDQKHLEMEKGLEGGYLNIPDKSTSHQEKIELVDENWRVESTLDIENITEKGKLFSSGLRISSPRKKLGEIEMIVPQEFVREDKEDAVSQVSTVASHALASKMHHYLRKIQD